MAIKVPNNDATWFILGHFVQSLLTVIKYASDLWPQKATIHNTKLSIEMFDSIILQDVGFCYTFIYYYRYSEDAFKLDILISQNSNQYNCYWCVGWLKKYYILYRLNSTENEKLLCNRFKCHFFILKYWILLLLFAES